MEENKITLKRFKNNYLTYLDILLEYRNSNSWFLFPEQTNLHTIPFLLTAASALECILNDHIIEYYDKTYDQEYSQQLINSFLSITLKGKLITVPTLLSNHKFIINQKHKTFHILSELIKLRNNLVHNKSEYELHTAYIKTDENGAQSIQPDVNFMSVLNDMENGVKDYTLGVKRNIGEYHDALEHFYECFFCVYTKPDFSGNDLIVLLSRSEQDSLSISLA